MTKSQLVAAVAARTGLPESEKAYVNPRTGQHTRLAPAMAPGFRPSGAMKRRLGLK